jgi:hypothetical protein
MTRLVHQAAIQERAANATLAPGSCGDVYGCDHYDEIRACHVIAALKAGEKCAPVFEDVSTAVSAVQTQVATILKVRRR